MSLVMKRPASSAPETNPAVVRGVSRQMSRDADAQRKRARTLAKQQQAAERVASASSQVSAGVNEAASAAEELKRASDEIASGAEEASGAAQESLAAITQITGAIDRQLNAAKDAQTRAQAMQRMVGKVNEEVQATVTNVGVAAQRQGESVKMVAELERQAANIGDIVKAVARIADQTNLLALNAAIEAARAGQHGKGFAVVADEVRTLAETSEKSAKQIQDLVGQIQGDVKNIAEGINEAAETVQSEAEKSKTIIQQLDKIGEDSVDIVAGANEIASAAQQSITAANQALKGAETIAAAATEQSSACEEAAKTVQEQSTALAECEQTASNLSELADELKNSTDIGKSAEEVASAAEELSSAVQEINRSASQIMVALEEIRKGAQAQSSATAESAAAISQIEKGAQLASDRASAARELASTIKGLMAENKVMIDGLISSISTSVEATRSSAQQIKSLELISRKIDKIVDAITQVSIQTNMLAVNGSIEAARAGEYGKGFVVVATDIRNLAHDSAENADRIKDLVKSIQDQIALVGRDLSEIMSSAMGEVEKAKSITAMLARKHLHALAVTASSYSGGEHVTFYSAAKPIEPLIRSQRLAVPTQLIHEHLLASSAIPFIFPAKRIHHHGAEGAQAAWYGDGAMRQTAPLSPAIHLGADKLLIIGAGRMNEPKNLTRSTTQYPTLAQIAGHAMASIFLDALAVDIERMNRINRTLALLPPQALAGTPLRPLQSLVIAPSQRIDDIAARHLHHLPTPVRVLLAGAGVGKTGKQTQGSALASYLLFEAPFTRELMALGEADTYARKDEVHAFFDWPQPAQAL